MTFVPNSPLIKFPRGGNMDALQWLTRVNSKDVFHDLRAVLPTDELPAAPEPSQLRTDYPNGPINPVATCPQTGRTLRLFLFRDLSCVLYREGPEGGHGWEVLPAILTIPADVWDEGLKEVEYSRRHSEVPRLRFKARPAGIHWHMNNGTITEEEVVTLLQASMEQVAKIILAHKPIADPRAHDMIPEGARFAPYSRFPAIDSDHPSFKRLEALTRSLALLRASELCQAFVHVTLHSKPIRDPWRLPTERDLVQAITTNQGNRNQQDKRLAKALRLLLNENLAELPDNIRLRPESVPILTLRDVGENPNNHEQMTALSLKRSDPAFQKLLACIET